MSKRKIIKIKTKYRTKEECINNCRDIKRKTFMCGVSKSISGEVNTNGTFKLSSTRKKSGMFEFIGAI